MSASKAGNGSYGKSKVVREYVHHDFTVLNAYVDGLVEKEAARVQQNLYLQASYKLKLIVLTLVALLVLSLCVFVWILSNQSLTRVGWVPVGSSVASQSEPIAVVEPTSAPTTATNTSSGDDASADVVSSENIKAQVERNAIKQSVSTLYNTDTEAAKAEEFGQDITLTEDLKIITNFTIFEKVSFENNELENIREVTTGLNFSKAGDTKPISQYCYARTYERVGNNYLMVDIGRVWSGRVRYHSLDASALREVSITRKVFNQLSSYCRFETP